MDKNYAKSYRILLFDKLNFLFPTDSENSKSDFLDNLSGNSNLIIKLEF
ncbi:hypothetical protein LEP1GSC008_1015 [Leptospira kirschneri serovar Bulgarica str. Nikolaevo]|uniref:Uncharacterized protein n=1 Tax=Leptospira kirschneri serovar Bulgarica str. Nikolaevo TaxID=1240687 RepID=M6FTS7_9LEPT|nr:hypothetical protein LEP1GSC008_1015 [Leptospira kirschneri serovar Bulgarica str. Nikolaevo]